VSPSPLVRGRQKSNTDHRIPDRDDPNILRRSLGINAVNEPPFLLLIKTIRCCDLHPFVDRIAQFEARPTDKALKHPVCNFFISLGIVELPLSRALFFFMSTVNFQESRLERYLMSYPSLSMSPLARRH
jgi:hypothetical protein